MKLDSARRVPRHGDVLAALEDLENAPGAWVALTPLCALVGARAGVALGSLRFRGEVLRPLAQAGLVEVRRGSSTWLVRSRLSNRGLARGTWGGRDRRAASA